ncbi:hypothetical protein Pfo_010159 [Paulownia fortunei]|nr:hypothetical protein Pfo_010159 [Paulownia fortunei]
MYNVQQHISKDMNFDQRNEEVYYIINTSFYSLFVLLRCFYNKHLNMYVFILIILLKLCFIFIFYFIKLLFAKHMMHGPSGHKNLNNSRMVDEKCKYHYLPLYCESTIQGKDGYIQSKTLKFNLNERYPTVINLYLYLLNQRCVIGFLATLKIKKPRKYLFGEFLEHYKKDVIRHTNTTNPIEGKRYYLMLLMNHVFNIFSRFAYKIQDEMLIKIPLEDYEVELKLNPKQYKVFFKGIRLYTKGESGKTFLYCALFAHLRSKNLIVLVSAISEVVATIIPRGRTTHSYFNIPIVANESSECTMSKWVCRAIVRTILVAKNEHVYKLNDKLIFMFLKEVRTFNSYDEIIDDTNNYYAEEFLNSLTQNGLSPHKMMLKRNCPIILSRYLDLSNELCNCKKSYTIVFRQHTGKHVFIPRILLFSTENKVYPFQYRFYLPYPVFSHDQLYIVISRGTPISILKVLIKLDTTNVIEKTWTKNVIYKYKYFSSK